MEELVIMHLYTSLEGYSEKIPDIGNSNFGLIGYKQRSIYDSSAIEYWSEIPDRVIPDILPHRYYISTFGNTYNATTRTSFGLSMHRKGYWQCNFTTIHHTIICRKIHLLVMRTFAYFPGCEKYEVNHMDGNKLNNRITNLEWCTSSENTIHAINNGLKTVFGNSYNVTITDEQAVEVIRLHKSGVSIPDIKLILGLPDSISNELLSNIGCGRSRLVAQRMYKELYENQ